MVVFILLCAINSAVLYVIGYGVFTWQHWVSMICVYGAYFVGSIGTIERIFKELNK
jgi:CHASE2 domain-containing sensor protein